MRPTKGQAGYRDDAGATGALYRCQNCAYWVGSRQATTAKACRRVLGRFFRAWGVCNEWSPR